MTLTVTWIGKTKVAAIQALTEEYLGRLRHYVAAEGMALKDESGLLKLCRHESGNRPARLILIDARGRQLSVCCACLCRQ